MTRTRTAVLLAIAMALIVEIALFRHASRIPPPAGRILAQTSADWGSLPFHNGECAVVNNAWNKAAASHGFEQSVFIEEVIGKQVLGWRWRAPWQFPPVVVSQPQVLCGNKPWDPKNRPDDGFPFLAGTRHVTADFDVRLRAHGVYNMSFSLWGVSAVPPSRKDITHEIMIWIDHHWQSPAGQRVDSLNVNGTNFAVYIEPHQHDASGANANTWTYVAFVPDQPVMHGPLDISAFLDYLLRRRTLTPNHYVTSIELGNEVSVGVGLTEIHDFAVNIR
jgi:Glycosyl hydrolase family 12